MQEPLTVLVAEDNPSDRLILSALLQRQGHRVVCAANGEEAVALFARERPQLVLLDALMPVMNGFEAAPLIKQMAGEELVPVIFLTALTESEALADCLEAGGDDFLPKPYNPVALEAKILAMSRLRQLQATVLEQRDLITRQHRQLLQEQVLAKTIFDRVTHAGCLDSLAIRHMQSPLALYNGDLLLAAHTPTGRLFVLLGDFTGHGLPAAIGAMPLAETFYRMVAEGYSASELLVELNALLKRILPVEMFCCATLLDLDVQHRMLLVWNGGLPDGWLARCDGSRQPLASRHLPLGVLEPARFDARFDAHYLAPGDRVVLLSDGVVEARNAAGELFGKRRLQAVLDANAEPAMLFDEIHQALLAFYGQLHDDVSLVEVLADEPGLPLSVVPTVEERRASSPQDWSVRYELRGETLARHNPLPLLLHTLLQVPELQPQVSAVYTVLGELYTNALEHGVLGLDSSLKRDAEGFARYYALRQQRLDALAGGLVRIELDFSRQGEGGRLCISVSDSGSGFDPWPLLAEPCTSTRLSGRGLRLVAQLGERLRRLPDERGLSVEFRWPRAHPEGQT